MIETEHPDEELLAQFTRSDDEAGPIVLHVSCDTNEKDKMKKQTKQQQQNRLRRSKKEVEIRRLIEERRNTPKEEKQRLKEVSKRIKNTSATKKE